jgi:hypothetical protein
MKKYIKPRLFFIFILLALLVTSCAPGNEKFIEDNAGFWMGLWHGFIALFTFIISLFSDNVTVYEINNSGNWYNFGFILGIAFFFGGGSRSSC